MTRTKKQPTKQAPKRPAANRMTIPKGYFGHVFKMGCRVFVVDEYGIPDSELKEYVENAVNANRASKFCDMSTPTEAEALSAIWGALKEQSKKAQTRILGQVLDNCRRGHKNELKNLHESAAHLNGLIEETNAEFTDFLNVVNAPR